MPYTNRTYSATVTAQRAAPRAAPVTAILATLVAALLLSLLPAAAAQAQKYSTAAEVVDALNAQPSPDTTIATMTMTITAASGHSLTREMQIWSADAGKSQLIKFLAPADVKGSGFLSVESASGTTETMIYLPALGRVRRVAGGQQQDAFFGSDFSYEDITSLSGDFGDGFDNTLLEVLPGPVYVIEARANSKSDSSYDRLVYQVPEDTLVPQRVEFYRGGTLVKVLTISATTKVDGYTLPSEIRMESVAGGSNTTLTQRDFSVDQDIPAEVFTERFLQR